MQVYLVIVKQVQLYSRVLTILH